MSGSGDSAPAGIPTVGGAPAATQAPAAPEKAGAGVPQAPATAPLERQIIRTGELSLSVDDVDKAAADLRAEASKLGGYVSNEEIVLPTPGSQRWGRSTLTVRVPSDSFEKAMDALASVGQLDGHSVKSDDVTERLVDLDSRIKTMRESIARLQKLMERAGSVSDIAAIEAQLTRRQADLESLLAQQKSLNSAASESTITVRLQAKNAAPVASNPFLEGLAGGWDAFLTSISVLLTLLGGLLPFAVVGGLIAWPIVVWRRHAKARAPKPKAPQAAYRQPWGGSQDPQQGRPAGPAEPAPVPPESEPEPQPRPEVAQPDAGEPSASDRDAEEGSN